jgi:predicted TIM-barrel fold metal-dependent hydrolase
MRRSFSIISFVALLCLSCNQIGSSNTTNDQPDKELAEFINNIKAVDNHAHPNTIEPDDKGSDALPLDGLGNIELPERLRPESPDWLASYKAVYGFKGDSLNEKDMKAMADTEANMIKQEGENFPTWALDQSKIEVMLGNRIAPGPGISAPRFRWVSYVDALLFPLSTKAEAITPDREKLFPLEEQLLKKYLAGLGLSKLPATLDEYLAKVVTATLESQKKNGCVALKFEAAYLRSLGLNIAEPQISTDFKIINEAVREVYTKNVNGGEPAHEKYKLLQDLIFRYIAAEAGRLGMAIHIHSFPGAGNYFIANDCDPLLLEPVFNDPALRNTKFVLIHGGGTFYLHTSALLWKPNVFADISLMTRLWSAHQIAIVLRDWLSQFPEKVLFGTDAFNAGPGLGWELNAWISSNTAREALTIALSGMMRDHEISPDRAKEIAMMVMRTNASKLYNLGLK